jgi:hypothetical protein
VLDDVPPQHREFARRVQESRLQDPRPTLENLSAATSVPVDDLVHHALVSWTSAGAEALLALEPRALRDLLAARRREDWHTVGGMIDWLAAGAGIE